MQKKNAFSEGRSWVFTVATTVKPDKGGPDPNLDSFFEVSVGSGLCLSQVGLDPRPEPFMGFSLGGSGLHLTQCELIRDQTHLWGFLGGSTLHLIHTRTH